MNVLLENQFNHICVSTPHDVTASSFMNSWRSLMKLWNHNQVSKLKGEHIRIKVDGNSFIHKIGHPQYVAHEPVRARNSTIWDKRWNAIKSADINQKADTSQKKMSLRQLLEIVKFRAERFIFFVASYIPTFGTTMRCSWRHSKLEWTRIDWCVIRIGFLFQKNISQLKTSWSSNAWLFEELNRMCHGVGRSCKHLFSVSNGTAYLIEKHQFNYSCLFIYLNDFG